MNEKKEFAAHISGQKLKLWNEGDLSVIEDIFAPRFVRYAPFFPPVEGLEAMAAHVSNLRIQYPDLTLTVYETIYDGRMLVSRWRWQGTDLGEIEGQAIPATGKQVGFDGVSLHHVKDGKLLDEYAYYDGLTVMQQLGLLPEMEI